jgi:hypothetical protein
VHLSPEKGETLARAELIKLCRQVVDKFEGDEFFDPDKVVEDPSPDDGGDGS